MLGVFGCHLEKPLRVASHEVQHGSEERGWSGHGDLKRTFLLVTASYFGAVKSWSLRGGRGAGGSYSDGQEQESSGSQNLMPHPRASGLWL